MPAFDKDFVLDNIHQNIDDLRYSLTDKIDGNKISSISKLPTKVIILCFSLQHRAVELAENSIKLFDQEHYLSSAILTRSLMETTALVFVTHKKVAKAVESQSLDELDDYLMRGIYGGKRDEDEFQSYNALTAIKHTAKNMRNIKICMMNLANLHILTGKVLLGYSVKELMNQNLNSEKISMQKKLKSYCFHY